MKNQGFDWHYRLKELRSERNLTQEDLAKLSGVKQPTISQYETGDRDGSINGLAKILDGMRVSFADFFCGCSSKKRKNDPPDLDISSIRRRSLHVVKSNRNK